MASSTRTTLGVLVLLTTLGCSPSTDSSSERVDAVEQPIVGGVPDVTSSAVVALAYRFGDATPVMCTATVIGRRAIVTAAHCVVPRRPFEVRFGARAAAPITTIPISRVFVHDAYDERTFVNDVAIVTVAVDVTVSPAIAGLDDAATPPAGETVRLVGFGLDKEEVTTRERHSGTAVVSDSRDGFLTLDAGPSRPCIGDSGGPVFRERRGHEELVGVISNGDRDCASFGRAVRLSTVEPFIRSRLADSVEPQSSSRGTSCAFQPRPMPTSLLGWLMVVAAAHVLTTLRRRRPNRGGH